jgi:hypothetical protein
MNSSLIPLPNMNTMGGQKPGFNPPMTKKLLLDQPDDIVVFVFDGCGQPANIATRPSPHTMTVF